MTDHASQPEWLTAEEAAAYLKVKTRSLLRWVRLGNLQAYTLSGTKRRVWRFRKEDLDSALLSKPVVSCNPLPVRSGKGAIN
jgi:excisionase family DNA binding protein